MSNLEHSTNNNKCHKLNEDCNEYSVYEVIIILFYVSTIHFKTKPFLRTASRQTISDDI